MSQSTAMFMLGRCLHFMRTGQTKKKQTKKKKKKKKKKKDVMSSKRYFKYNHTSKKIRLISIGGLTWTTFPGLALT